MCTPKEKAEIDKEVHEWWSRNQDVVEKINNSMNMVEINSDITIDNFSDTIDKLIQKSERYHKEFLDEIKGNNT